MRAGHALVALRVGPAVEMRRIARLHREAQILGDRHARKQVGDLERTAESCRGNPVWRQSRDRLAGEHDRTVIGREHAGDEVEDGRLAGAVGSDQRVQRTIANGERRIGHRLDAAERLREVARLQHHAVAGMRLRAQEFGQRHALLDRARAIAAASTTLGLKGSVSRRQTPTSPLGEKTMKPTNSSPKYSSQFGVQIDRYSWNRM